MPVAPTVKQMCITLDTLLQHLYSLRYVERPASSKFGVEVHERGIRKYSHTPAPFTVPLEHFLGAREVTPTFTTKEVAMPTFSRLRVRRNTSVFHGKDSRVEHLEEEIDLSGNFEEEYLADLARKALAQPQPANSPTPKIRGAWWRRIGLFIIDFFLG